MGSTTFPSRNVGTVAFFRATPVTPSFAEYCARLSRVAGHIWRDSIEWRTRRNLQSEFLINGAMLAIAAGYAIPVQIAPVISRIFFGSSLTAEITESDARKQGTLLADSAGRWLGNFPGSLDSDRRYNETAMASQDTDISGRSFVAYPDHKTIFVETPPAAYTACIRRLEDRNLGSPVRRLILNPHGVDALGLLRIFTSGGSAGGSSLSSIFVQQLVRPKADRETHIDKARRKLEETFWSVPIMFSVAPGNRTYDQLAARHLPHVSWVQGERGLVWGAESGARLLFSRPLNALSPAESFVLAGAIKRPIQFSDGVDQSGRVIDRTTESVKSWNKALFRARACAVDSEVLPNHKDRDAAIAELDVMSRTVPSPHADPVINRLGQDRYGARWPEKARDPARRASIFAFSAMRGLRREFTDALGPAWSRVVSRVTMSIDVIDERRFAPAFRTLARDWLADRSDLNPIYRFWATYDAANGANEPEVMPEIIAAAVDGEGKIVRYYSSLESQPFFGEIRNKDGIYQPEKEDRALASLAKVGAGLVLLRAGAVDAEARRDFAHSDTDAIEARLMATDPREEISRDVLKALHWGEASSRREDGRPLRLSLALSSGSVSASPRTILWGSSAITAALAGDARPRTVQPPTLIKTVQLVDLGAGRLLPPMSGLPDPYANASQTASLADAWAWSKNSKPQARSGISSDSLISPSNRYAAIALFSAPVCNGGTLAALSKKWCAPSATQIVWAKTGTLDVSKSYSRSRGERVTGAVQRVAITGGVVFPDGRKFSFFLSIAGTGAGRPLTVAPSGARGLEASALSPLLDFILNDLAHDKEGPPNVQ